MLSCHRLTEVDADISRLRHQLHTSKLVAAELFTLTILTAAHLWVLPRVFDGAAVAYSGMAAVAASTTTSVHAAAITIGAASLSVYTAACSAAATAAVIAYSCFSAAWSAAAWGGFILPVAAALALFDAATVACSAACTAAAWGGFILPMAGALVAFDAVAVIVHTMCTAAAWGGFILPMAAALAIADAAHAGAVWAVVMLMAYTVEALMISAGLVAAAAVGLKLVNTYPWLQVYRCPNRLPVSKETTTKGITAADDSDANFSNEGSWLLPAASYPGSPNITSNGGSCTAYTGSSNNGGGSTSTPVAASATGLSTDLSRTPSNASACTFSSSRRASLQSDWDCDNIYEVLRLLAEGE